MRILGVSCPFFSYFVLGGEEGRLLFICGHFWKNHVLATLENDSQRCRKHVSGVEECTRDRRGQLQLPLVPPSSWSWGIMVARTLKAGKTNSGITGPWTWGQPQVYEWKLLRTVTFSTMIKHDRSCDMVENNIISML